MRVLLEESGMNFGPKLRIILGECQDGFESSLQGKK